MSPQGPPGDRAADEGSRAAGGRFPAQPCPTAQSVLWRPAVQALARPDSDATLIFVAQRALAAVEDHLLSAAHPPPRATAPPPPPPRQTAALLHQRPRRSAGRLLPTGGRCRLARALPAVLRAARARELSGRCEKPARLLEHLLVARCRGVARARRAASCPANYPIGAPLGCAPGDPAPHGGVRGRLPQAAPASGRRPRGLGLVDRGRRSDRRGSRAGRTPGAP